MPKDVCVHPMTAAANVGHAWNVNSASGICKISAKQMLDQESIFFLQPTMDYGHRKAKFLILCGPNSNRNSKQISGMWTCSCRPAISVHGRKYKSTIFFDVSNSWFEHDLETCQQPRSTQIFVLWVVSWGLEATPSATPFFKRAYKISHNPGL